MLLDGWDGSVEGLKKREVEWMGPLWEMRRGSRFGVTFCGWEDFGDCIDIMLGI